MIYFKKLIQPKLYVFKLPDQTHDVPRIRGTKDFKQDLTEIGRKLFKAQQIEFFGNRHFDVLRIQKPESF